MTSCKRPVFFPGGPCCGGAVCLKWPKIDWSAFTWLVRHPNARQILQNRSNSRRGAFDVASNMFGYITDELRGFTAHENFSQVGTDFQIFGPDVIFGPGAEWYRGGEYLSQYSGNCSWRVHNRERLFHGRLAVISVVVLRFGWKVENVFYHSFVASPFTLLEQSTIDEWLSKEVRVPALYRTFTGTDETTGRTVVLEYYIAEAESVYQNDRYVSGRDVLKRLACHWVPFFDAAGDIPREMRGDLFGSFFHTLNNLRDRDPATWPGHEWLYKPNALDVAASMFLEPGFVFGFVSDKRSPLFGQFTCLEGATYAADEPNPPFAVSVPWDLTTGPEVVAELGFTNRFERNDSQHWLPEWLELELVRV